MPRRSARNKPKVLVPDSDEQQPGERYLTARGSPSCFSFQKIPSKTWPKRMVCTIFLSNRCHHLTRVETEDIEMTSEGEEISEKTLVHSSSPKTGKHARNSSLKRKVCTPVSDEEQAISKKTKVAPTSGSFVHSILLTRGRHNRVLNRDHS